MALHLRAKVGRLEWRPSLEEVQAEHTEAGKAGIRKGSSEGPLRPWDVGVGTRGWESAATQWRDKSSGVARLAAEATVWFAHEAEGVRPRTPFSMFLQVGRSVGAYLVGIEHSVRSVRRCAQAEVEAAPCDVIVVTATMPGRVWEEEQGVRKALFAAAAMSDMLADCRPRLPKSKAKIA